MKNSIIKKINYKMDSQCIAITTRKTRCKKCSSIGQMCKQHYLIAHPNSKNTVVKKENTDINSL